MKGAFALAAFVLCCAAQQPEAPIRRGLFVDPEGLLRALTGPTGGQKAVLVGSGQALAAGASSKSSWYAVGRTLFVTGRGEETSCAVPDGGVLGSFDLDGLPFAFYFPQSNQQARWDAGTGRLGPMEDVPLEANQVVVAIGPAGPHSDQIALVTAEEGAGGAALVSPSGEVLRYQPAQPGTAPESMEWLDDGVALLRAGGVLKAWRPGEEAQLLPLADPPGFALYYRDPAAGETPVGESFTFASAAPGETSEARFRIRNPTAASVTINRLSIDPGPFRTFDQFFPPRIIAAGDFADFSIRFAPTEAGEFERLLHVNDLLVKLRGSSTGLPFLEIEVSGAWKRLTTGSATDLGTVERRATLERRSRVVTPPGATAAAPPAISGEGFSLSADGADEFVIRFSAEKAGSYSGSLDFAGRSFAVTATASEFSAPRPIPTIDAAQLKSGSQQKVTVEFSENSRVQTTGTLKLVFRPDTAGSPDDSSIAFLPQLTRQVGFTVKEGATRADFNGSDGVSLQTGTTAGTIVLQATVGSVTREASFHIAPAPVSLQSAKASVAPGAAEVVAVGFDNARSVSKVTFTFILKSGLAAAPGRIEKDVSATFQDYFKGNPAAGGSFALRANFPVSGAASELIGVEVEIANSQGTCQTGRLRFE
jgi:hypothetical protein